MLLAWIGDAALQSIASDELILRYGAAAAAVGSRIQSPLSIARTQVLSRGGCARNARILGLDAPGLIITGQSYKGHYKGHYEGQVSKDMLGETFEACIGAVTLDAGRAASRAAYLRADPFPVAALKDLGGVYAEAAEAEAALAAAAAAAQAGGASLSEQQQPAGG
jgi:dsRNA-specific ribonuclease